jgi:hypothetical protein
LRICNNNHELSKLILASSHCTDCEDWDEATRQVLVNGPKPKWLMALMMAGERMKVAIGQSLQMC